MNVQVYNKLKQYIDLVLGKTYQNITDYVDNAIDDLGEVGKEEVIELINTAIIEATTKIEGDALLASLAQKLNTLYPYDDRKRLLTSECKGVDLYDPYQVIITDSDTGEKLKPSQYVSIGDWVNRKCPTTKYVNTTSKNVGAYFSEWSIYSEAFFPKDFPWEDFTHVYYSFVGIKGMVSPNAWMPSYNSESINRDLYSLLILDRFATLQTYQDSDDEAHVTHTCKGNFAELVRIKKKWPDKKIILSMGGWSLSDSWHFITNNSCNIKKFVDNVVKFIEVFDFFDGVDIDYEFPIGDGLSWWNGHFKPNEMINYSMMVKMLVDALKPMGKTVSMTLGVDYKHINQLDPTMMNYCDRVNLMTYDFYGSWSLSEFGFNSSLYANPLLAERLCTDWVVNYLTNKGVDKHKLNIGIAAYGRGWQGLKPVEGKDTLTLDDILSGNVDTSEVIPFQYGTLGIPTSEEGFASLTAILDGIEANKDKDGFEYGEDKEYSKSGYFIDQDTGSFMTYDNKYTAQEKAKYVLSKDIGGCFYWEAQTDKKFAIINGIHEGLGSPIKSE